MTHAIQPDWMEGISMVEKDEGLFVDPEVRHTLIRRPFWALSLW